MILATPTGSSIAGIIGAGAGVITALAVLIGAITVLLPTLRGFRKAQDQQTTTLNTIHALVNSTLSAAIKAELEATQREIAMMNEVVDLRKRAGLDITPETTAALERSRQRVLELRTELHERELQAQAIDTFKTQLAAEAALTKELRYAYRNCTPEAKTEPDSV